MPEPKQIEAHWPVAGLNASVSKQTQPPYTTPDAVNVMPKDVFHRRQGGSRPGFGPAFYGKPGGNHPIRMLSSVDLVTRGGPNVFPEDFVGGSLGVLWNPLTDMNPVRQYPSIDGENQFAYTSSLEPQGAYHAPIANMDVTKRQEVGLFLVPYRGAWYGRAYLWMWLDDTTPGADVGMEGIAAWIEMTGTDGSYTGNMTSYEGGVDINSYNFSGTLGSGTGYAHAGWFKLGVGGNNIYTKWHGIEVANNVHGLTLPWTGGTTFAFGFYPTVADGRVQAKYFRHYYYPETSETTTRSLLVTSMNGEVYVEGFPGEFGGGAANSGDPISTSCTLASDRLIMAAPYRQRLYIADFEEDKAVGVDGVVSIANPERLTSASIADWTTVASAGDDVVVISPTSPGASLGGITAGTYDILWVFAGYLHLAPSPGDGVSLGNCKFQVVRSPKVLDVSPESTADLWANGVAMVPRDVRRSAQELGVVFEVTAVVGTRLTGAAEPAWNTTVGGTTVDNEVTWTTRSMTLLKWYQPDFAKGAVPVNCDKIAQVNGRVTLADTAEFYQARRDDPTDFDYSAGDPETAVWSQTALAGRVGKNITAIASHGEDRLVIGTKTETWMVTGDLAGSGFSQCLTRDSGIVSRTAWCWGPGGSLFFLANDGISVMVPGSSYPEKLSKQPLPKELQNIDANYFDVLMAYDRTTNGVLTYLAASEPRPVSNFWYSLDGGSPWRITLSGYMAPTVLHSYTPFDSAEACIVHGNYAGQLMRYRDEYEGDEDTVTVGGEILRPHGGYVIIGPMMMVSGGEGEAVLEKMVAVLVDDSGPVTCTVRTAPTAEGCLNANIYAQTPPLANHHRLSTFTFAGGQNSVKTVSQRGAFVAIILGGGSSTRAWAVETLQLYISRGGERRI